MYAAHGVGNHPRQRRYYEVRRPTVETGLAPSCMHHLARGRSRGMPRLYGNVGAILEPDASHAALSLELHPWPPDCALAQSLSSVAHRDLHRRQNDQDRIPGILGILVDGGKQPVALS